MSANESKMSNFRWIICSLLFFATTVNYLDRQVLSLTYKDFIAPVFGWTDNDYGTITAVFSIIYALCNLFAGKFIDKLGTKKGYLWAIFIWSLGACLHAGCGVGTSALKAAGFVAMMGITASVWLFLACRAVLALGEAGNFPAAIKVTAEYFPKKDRAFATSIFNSGSSVGALAAPLTIPIIAKFWGWEMAFIVIGALGFVWMGFWVWLYKKPAENPRVNAAELKYIESDDATDGASGGPAPRPMERLVLQFLPDFALWPGMKLRVKVAFDDGAAQEVAVPKSDSNIGEKDPVRNAAVQDNFIRVRLPISKGATAATVTAVDPGVVLDRVGVE